MIRFFVVICCLFQAGFCGRIEDPFHRLSDDERAQLEERLENLANTYDVGVYVFAYSLVKEGCPLDEATQAVIEVLKKNGANFKPDIFVYYGEGSKLCAMRLCSDNSNAYAQEVLTKAYSLFYQPDYYTSHQLYDVLDEHIHDVDVAFLCNPYFAHHEYASPHELIQLVYEKAYKRAYPDVLNGHSYYDSGGHFVMYSILIDSLDEAVLQAHPDLFMYKILAWFDSDNPRPYSYEDCVRDCEFIMAHAVNDSSLFHWARLRKMGVVPFFMGILDQKQSNELIQCQFDEWMGEPTPYQELYHKINQYKELEDRFWRFNALFSRDPRIILDEVELDKTYWLDDEGNLETSCTYRIKDPQNSSQFIIVD